MKKKPLNILLFILNLVSIIICLFFCFFGNRLFPYILVLVAYTFFTTVFKENTRQLLKRPGLIILNIFMFIRYNIAVLIYYITGKLSKFGVSEQKFILAVALMIYEMLVIFLAITFFYQKSRNKATYIKRRYELNTHRKHAILVIALFILIICSVLDKSLRPNWGLLVGKSRPETINNVSGAWGILWQAACLTVYLVVVFDCYYNYVNTQRMKYVYYTIVFSTVYIFYIYICQDRISRWYVAVTAIAIMFTFAKIFKRQIKKILPIFGLVFLLIIGVATLMKTGNVADTSSVWDMLAEIFNSTTFDGYFAGVNNINTALVLKEESKTSILNMFYDLLSTMPIINHYIDANKVTANMFGNIISRTDQIIPLLGQGALYFGYILSPLLSLLCVCLTSTFDKKYSINNSPMIFVYAFTSIWSGLMLCLNLSIYISWVYVRIIPFFLVGKLVETLIQPYSQKSWSFA